MLVDIPQQPPTQEAHFLLPDINGQQVEALLTPVDNPHTPMAILCHPHPLFDGTMHNKVVTTMMRACRELGIPSLRFNFRGVGQSSGEFNAGLNESEDVVALFNWLQTLYPNRDLLLAGFSFGAFVASRAARLLNPKALINIAPAVENFDFSDFAVYENPYLIIQGEDDETVSPQAVYDYVTTLTPPPQLIRMDNCSHFFHGRLVELKQHLLDFLEQV